MILAQEFLRHTLILVNGLEYPSYQIGARLGRNYLLKVVGDNVWEAARRAGLTALSIDEFHPEPHLNPFLQRLTAQRDLYVKNAHQVITPSDYLKRMVSGWGVEPSRIVTIPNGVPLHRYERFGPKRREPGPFRAAFCGRLTNWKGVETLFLSASGMKNVEIDVVGDGPEMPMLVMLAHQLQIGRTVKFYGRLAQEQVQNVLSMAHVLVLMSQYEGLSHTLLEACAMALPCVATNCGGNPEVIEAGVHGFLIPYGEVEQLRISLERLQDDEELRFQLACNAKENSRRFDFDRTVVQTMEVMLNS